MPDPTPQQPSRVQVLRTKATASAWVNEWVDLSEEISLNRSTAPSLRLRAKISSEATGWCRRLVVWTLLDGSTTWVRHGESNWWTEGRWYCDDAESGWQEFSISIPVGTKMRVWVATENREIQVNSKGQRFRRYGSSILGSVWSNRYPTAEQQTATGVTVGESNDLELKWKIVDEDDDSAQSAYGIQIRRAAYGDIPAGSVLELDTGTIADFMPPTQIGIYTITGGDYAVNMWHEWRVIVKDYDRWSIWSPWRTFFVVGDEETPVPLSPAGNVSVDISLPTTFKWEFRDDVNPSSQQLANLRYRAVGAVSWTLVSGDVTTPGAETSWTLPPFTFASGVQYEWQVQTQSSSVSGLSDWSTTATFWTAPPISSFDPGLPSTATVAQGTLGCGRYRVFIYDRGGKTLRGEITPIKNLQWDRRRDDISQASVTTNGYGDDCAALLKTVESWMHEIVIYRDGVRVWEGPVTRITEEDDGVQIAAHDPMVYVYRRALRMGYNDAYPNLQTTVFRATRIIQDALAYDDPNVLGYLTPINNLGDARESRVVASWSKSAWEEVDDMAANAGLDYTTVGRRIILWDVHREIGRLPEMTNGDFSDPVVVTQYGMLTANVFAVTNNAGVYSYVQTFTDDPGPYGHIEMVASSYGETEGTVTEALTPEALEDLQNVLKGQATRNISGRYPTPVIVRVPDNTTLSPEVEIGINQLVPGVRIPLRSVGRLREITQLQRLDRLTATANDEEDEKIKVVMSPAPSEAVESEPEAPPE